MSTVRFVRKKLRISQPKTNYEEVYESMNKIPTDQRSALWLVFQTALDNQEMFHAWLTMGSGEKEYKELCRNLTTTLEDIFDTYTDDARGAFKSAFTLTEEDAGTDEDIGEDGASSIIIQTFAAKYHQNIYLFFAKFMKIFQYIKEQIELENSPLMAMALAYQKADKEIGDTKTHSALLRDEQTAEINEALPAKKEGLVELDDNLKQQILALQKNSDQAVDDLDSTVTAESKVTLFFNDKTTYVMRVADYRPPLMPYGCTNQLKRIHQSIRAEEINQLRASEIKAVVLNQNAIVRELIPICVQSLEFDHSIFNRGYNLVHYMLGGEEDLLDYNKTFVTSMVQNIIENKYSQVIFMNGSTRQSILIDNFFAELLTCTVVGAKADGSTSFKTTNKFKAIIESFTKEHTLCTVDGYLLADTFEGLPLGTTFGNAMKGMTPDLNKDIVVPIDFSRLLVLYAQMHKIASENYAKSIYFEFYFAAKEDGDKTLEFLNRNNELIPSNIVLSLIYYAGGKPIKVGTVLPKEESIIDFCYQENVKILEDACSESNEMTALDYSQLAYGGFCKELKDHSVKMFRFDAMDSFNKFYFAQHRIYNTQMKFIMDNKSSDKKIEIEEKVVMRMSG
jgi:hypothetical protein